jgi:hypothetical protein
VGVDCLVGVMKAGEKVTHAVSERQLAVGSEEDGGAGGEALGQRRDVVDGVFLGREAGRDTSSSRGSQTRRGVSGESGRRKLPLKPLQRANIAVFRQLTGWTQYLRHRAVRDHVHARSWRNSIQLLLRPACSGAGEGARVDARSLYVRSGKCCCAYSFSFSSFCTAEDLMFECEWSEAGSSQVVPSRFRRTEREQLGAIVSRRPAFSHGNENGNRGWNHGYNYAERLIAVQDRTEVMQ